MTLQRQHLVELWQQTRQHTMQLMVPLQTEDFVVQSMPDVSPPKWHLAHTTWFFEQFILRPFAASYQVVDEQYHFLFNSYYQSLGKLYTRADRGLMTRPTVDEIVHYRRTVDEALAKFLSSCEPHVWEEVAPILEVGVHHEKQHQELLLMDIKYNFYQNPLFPAYGEKREEARSEPTPLTWKRIESGLYDVGASGDAFAYDNERPRHRTYLMGAELATRLTTNDEYLAFMEAGGYEDSQYWLSDGWDLVQREERKAPLYWLQKDGDWYLFTLFGLQPLAGADPVCHLNYYEADAFARWADARLPTEQEWEVAAAHVALPSTKADGEPRALASKPSGTFDQMYGDVWQWTSSAYAPYPGFKALQGALGEYNGKFMVNQYVLRGGSAATPDHHMRMTYRNFFYPHCSWQFSGVRLARDL